MAVVDELIQVLKNLGGEGTLTDIYSQYSRINPNYREATIRRTLQQYSSDTESYLNKGDHFFSVNGLGNGIWGLRNFIIENIANGAENGINSRGTLHPGRILRLDERIIRDTILARHIKRQVGGVCQLCGVAIRLSGGQLYCEAHHVKPLGTPYNGPDIRQNILVVCPNCHVMCDYQVIELRSENIRNNVQEVSEEYIRFHNQLYTTNLTGVITF